MHTAKTPANAPARLIDVNDVAKMLGVSSRHVYRLADGGRMPRPLKLGGAVRWSMKTINEWIDAGCPSGTPSKGGRR